ncbi:hypothetical protein HCH54_003608 [Aspergillus fumigatus]
MTFTVTAAEAIGVPDEVVPVVCVVDVAPRIPITRAILGVYADGAGNIEGM